MFYSLLDYLACPACRHGLTLLLPREEPQSTAMRMPPARRTSPKGALVGPLAEGASSSRLGAVLAPYATVAAEDGRDRTVAIVDGLLVCTGCDRWYPVRRGLPEVLPDHLRDWEEDRSWLEGYRAVMESAGLGSVWPTLDARAGSSPQVNDEGAHYKRAEIAVTRRALPKGFFDWADVAPFKPSAPAFSLDLVARYVTTVSRLDCGVNGMVFDLGCGTGWTTEWLVRLGYQPIGVDLCRDYVLAGMARRGRYAPHFVIGDVENIPLRDECIHAALSYDAFHHVPDRPRAMAEIARIMRPGATMVLTEPGPEHERAAVSVDVMQQHGILERGFDEAGLASYIKDTALGDLHHYRSDTHPHDLYSLRKAGTFEIDSRTPRALVAGLQPESPSVRIRAGESPELTIALLNRGDTIWLAETPDEAGEVHLGVQLFDDSRRMLKEDYARVKLPHDVRPGQSVRLRCALPPLLRPGTYLIELDMVDTHYLWFKEYAYQPVSWTVRVEGDGRDAAPGPLVGDWPDRIVPEQLEMPEPPQPAEIRSALPPVPRGWPRLIMHVWRTEGLAAVAARIRTRLLRLFT